MGVTAADNRLFVEAVLYRYRTGMPWRDLPERFGDWKNVHQRFSRWAKSGVWEKVFLQLSADADNEYVRTRTRTLRSVIVRSARRDAGNLVRVTHRGQRSFQTAPAGRDAPDRSAVTAFASCLTGGRSYMAVSV